MLVNKEMKEREDELALKLGKAILSEMKNGNVPNNYTTQLDNASPFTGTNQSLFG